VAVIGLAIANLALFFGYYLDIENEVRPVTNILSSKLRLYFYNCN